VHLKIIFAKNHEQTMKHLLFKLGPLPTESAETYKKTEKNLQIVYCSTKYWIINPKWSNIFGNCFGPIWKLSFDSSFTKSINLWHSESKKWLFHAKKMKTFFSNIVCYSESNNFAEYRIIWINYAMLVAMTSLFSLKVKNLCTW
jgi:hypothetical protein